MTDAVVLPDDPFGEQLTVLHVWQPTEAGVPRYAWAAAEFQAAHGWRVHAACPNPTPHPGVTTHRWDAQRNPVRGVRSEGAAVRRLVDRIRPDVVVAHSAKAGLMVRTALRGTVPTVYVPHAWPHLALPAAARPAAIAWERWAARWTTAIVAVGDGEAAEGRRHGVTAPILVVRNPVPDGWSRASTQQRAEARESLGLGTEPTVVCVGRFSRQKAQDVLVAAWPQVRARIPDAVLLLVGDGPTMPEVRAQAGPGVVFLGATDDPRPLLAAADVAVLPSRWEGLSLSMLEAMAAGRSLVVTDVSGSEVVTAADAGAVVDVDDPDALAEAMTARLSGAVDPVAEGRRAAAYVEREHDFATEMTRLAQVERWAADTRTD